jgi:hypothetical protein
MLTEICAYLHNYFDYERHSGEISIVNGVISCNGKEITLEEGQYFALFRNRIPLGVFNEVPADKKFEGSVWLMDVPKAVLDADKWAKEWNEKYGAATSEANSVFQSESFGGYSYSKDFGSSDNKRGGSIFDNSQFNRMLAPYRKLP